MERCFAATEESKWLKDYNNYLEKAKQQREFVNKFFREKGIESEEYMVGANGFMNVPFEERNKSNISLSIKPTENDLEKYGKTINKPGKYGLCKFRKTSAILKEFQEECIDKRVPINLWEPDIRDYFEHLHWNRCSQRGFKYEGNWYIKIESEFLKEDDTPQGFKEIKASEYYMVKEKREEDKNKEE